MKRAFLIVGLGGLMGGILFLVTAVGEEKIKELPFDKGPKTIDVSKYPAEMQANYKIFALRCAKCHTLARPVNAPYCLPDEWERYIKRMMRKPGSGINSGDGKKIYEFLKYDSSVRKKDCIEQKLKAVPQGDTLKK